MDCHRAEWLDVYIGKRVSIKRLYGTYFGVLKYADGYYYMDKPEFRNVDGIYIKYHSWKVRKGAIKKRDIREIGDAIVYKGENQ